MQSVLVTRGNGLAVDRAAIELRAVVGEDLGAAAQRRIERNLNFNALGGSADLHPLVGHRLCGDGEVQPAALAKVHQRADQTVGLEFRVTLDQRNRAHRFAAEQQARGDDGIAADVVQRAAADIGLVADIGRIAVEIRKVGLDRAQVAQSAAAHAVAHGQPLRVKAHHKGFHDVHLLRDLAQLRGLGRRQSHGLLAQHVLARARRHQRQRHVLVVRQGVVDGFNLGVGQQFLVAAVGLWDTQFVGQRTAPLQIARGDGADVAVPRRLHAGNDFFPTDAGGAEHAPEYFFHGVLALVRFYK